MLQDLETGACSAGILGRPRSFCTSVPRLPSSASTFQWACAIPGPGYASRKHESSWEGRDPAACSLHRRGPFWGPAATAGHAASAFVSMAERSTARHGTSWGKSGKRTHFYRPTPHTAHGSTRCTPSCPSGAGAAVPWRTPRKLRRAGRSGRRLSPQPLGPRLQRRAPACRAEDGLSMTFLTRSPCCGLRGALPAAAQQRFPRILRLTGSDCGWRFSSEVRLRHGPVT